MNQLQEHLGGNGRPKERPNVEQPVEGVRQQVVHNAEGRVEMPMRALYPAAALAVLKEMAPQPEDVPNTMPYVAPLPPEVVVVNNAQYS